MLAILQSQNTFVYVMLGFLVLGVIHKLVLGTYYKRMGAAAENMGLSNRKMLKAVKTKYENSFKLNMGVNDTSLFVDKYLQKQKFCGIPIALWDKFGGQVMAICLGVGMIGTLYTVAKDDTMKHILSTFLFSLIAVSVLLFLDFSFNTRDSKKRLALNIKDYLENYLSHRIAPDQVVSPVKAEAEVMEEPAQPARSTKDDLMQLKNCLNEIASARNLEQHQVTEKEEEFLEDILRDYFL